MPRASIRARTNAAVVDNGSVDIPVIKGEQLSFTVTHGAFTNLASATITGTLIEGDNASGGGQVPESVKSGASTQSLTILEEDGTALVNDTFPSDYSSNKFKLVIEDTLFDAWSPQPTPGDSGRVYGFFEVTVEDDGSGSNQVISKDLRGTITVRYSVGD